MLVMVAIVYIYLKKSNILFQGKERSAETKLMPEKLRAVLATFRKNVVC